MEKNKKKEEGDTAVLSTPDSCLRSSMMLLHAEAGLFSCLTTSVIHRTRSEPTSAADEDAEDSTESEEDIESLLDLLGAESEEEVPSDLSMEFSAYCPGRRS